jgi:hypothetical protein
MKGYTPCRLSRRSLAESLTISTRNLAGRLPAAPEIYIRFNCVSLTEAYRTISEAPHTPGSVLLCLLHRLFEIGIVQLCALLSQSTQPPMSTFPSTTGVPACLYPLPYYMCPYSWYQQTSNIRPRLSSSVLTVLYPRHCVQRLHTPRVIFVYSNGRS